MVTCTENVFPGSYDIVEKSLGFEWENLSSSSKPITKTSCGPLTHNLASVKGSLSNIVEI